MDFTFFNIPMGEGLKKQGKKNRVINNVSDSSHFLPEFADFLPEDLT
jgi:hypothetical protein